MEERPMPRKGRVRLISNKASGTKLFIDDLREVIRLAELERRGTISDCIRDLVHEALAYRRVRAMGRDATEEPLRRIHQQAISAGINPLEIEIREMKEMIRKLTLGIHSNGNHARENPSRISPPLTEIIGFTVAIEMKVHLLLQNFLLSRGLGEEDAQKLISQHEEKSRKNAEKIIVGLMKS
jgi:hypothetical protein